MKTTGSPKKAPVRQEGENKSTKNPKHNAGPNRLNHFILLSAILVITILFGYSNLLKNELLNWDDNLYVTENADINGLQADNLKAFFTKKYVSNYLPLTMISYALDYKIGKLNPKIYTGTNLFIHTLNALLVFWLISLLLKRITNSGNKLVESSNTQQLVAFITAALFALHPLQVESVAWVSERKNVLYTLFFLLSLISYIKYIEQNKYSLLVFSVILFTMSLLSKGVAVSLALCVVIIDYYYGRKLLSTKVILEKIPFFLLALAFGIVAFKSQHEENILVGNVNYPFYEQLAFASYGFVNYIIKLIIPVKISAYYSYPQTASLVHYACLLMVLALIVALLLYRKKISTLAAFGILFYIANLVFLVQIIPVGNALMADRYIYVSSIGFFLLLALGVQKISENYKLIYALAIVVILIFTYTTHQRVKVWNNSLVFWDDVISKDNHIPRAWNNRGVVKKDKGDNEGALYDFNQAIAIMPEFHEAYNNKGIALYNLGRVNEAVEGFTKAIEIDSVYTDALCNRGLVLNSLNNTQRALDDLNRTLRLDPNYLKAYTGRAEVKIKLDDFSGAIADCDQALSLNNTMADAYSVKGLAFYNQANYTNAIDQYSKAIQLSPQNMNNYHNRGASYFYLGNYQAAVQDMNIVLQYLPDQGVSYYIRGMAYALSGNDQQACYDLNTAINKGFTAAKGDYLMYCGRK